MIYKLNANVGESTLLGIWRLFISVSFPWNTLLEKIEMEPIII